MGKWTDDRCTTYWGNVQCLDDLDHIENDNGGKHAFDIKHLGFFRPVLIKDSDKILREVNDDQTKV